MTLRSKAERLSLSWDMTGPLSEISDFCPFLTALYRCPESGVMETEMDELIDFASVLIKLVIILLVVLMASTLLLAPLTALQFAVPMVMLVVPLFVLTTVLDLAGILCRSQAESPREFRHG